MRRMKKIYVDNVGECYPIKGGVVQGGDSTWFTCVGCFRKPSDSHGSNADNKAIAVLNYGKLNNEIQKIANFNAEALYQWAWA